MQKYGKEGRRLSIVAILDSPYADCGSQVSALPLALPIEEIGPTDEFPERNLVLQYRLTAARVRDGADNVERHCPKHCQSAPEGHQISPWH
jgi:hypothetical protein